MNRKATILISIVLIAALSATVFGQKGGGGRSKGRSGGSSFQKKQNFNSNRNNFNGHRHNFGSGQHHFKSNFGHGQHHFKNSGGQKLKHHNQGNRPRNLYGNGHRFHGHAGHGHAFHGKGHFTNHHYAKYLKAQRYFTIRSKLHLVQFYNFPYDVCWHNGKYWVCYNGYWMPYSYLIQNHAGAWNWHQAHYRYHNHAYFKKNWKQGKVKLVYSKK